MTYDTNEIKSRISVWELLKKLGHDVTPTRRAFKSPLREDKNPSFSVYADGRRWKDFGTGEGGTIIDLLKVATGCSTKDAIKELAIMAGVQTEDMDGSPLSRIPKPNRKVVTKIEPLLSIEKLRSLRVNLKHFLRNPSSSAMQSLDWIPGDRLQEILKKGWLGADFRGDLAYLMRRGYKVRTSPRSSRGDRWRMGKACQNMFVSFLDDDITNPDKDKLILCEGESDTIAATLQWGDKYKVAGCLSATIMPPDEILYPLIRGVRQVTVIFDGDQAGRIGAARVVDHVKKMVGSNIKVSKRSLPEGEDIKSVFIKQKTKQIHE